MYVRRDAVSADFATLDEAFVATDKKFFVKWHPGADGAGADDLRRSGSMVMDFTLSKLPGKNAIQSMSREQKVGLMCVFLCF